MFVEAVPEQARRNLAVLAQAGITQPFYLAGGTAVAFHLGHRISVVPDLLPPVATPLSASMEATSVSLEAHLNRKPGRTAPFLFKA